MIDELTVEQACRQKLLAPEDYLHDCWPDGSVKTHSKTTTIFLRNHESKSVTVNTQVLQVALVGAAIGITIIIVFIIKRLVRKKVTKRL